MSEVSVGDPVIYNGYPYENLFTFEEKFIKDNLVVGKSYRVIKISDKNFETGSDYDTGMVWYCIVVDNETMNTYWLPSICFGFNIKEKYGLR